MELTPRATVETWRATHHPDYDVSNLGRVRSRARGPLRILKSAPNSQGYLQVVFGRRDSQKIHRLVAAAFIGPCPIGQEVRHKDDNPGNARWDNLEYGTRSQNRMDCVLRGRDRSPKGEDSALATQLTNAKARRIKEEIAALPFVGKSNRRPKGSLSGIAADWGVSAALIHDMAYGRCWRHV